MYESKTRHGFIHHVVKRQSASDLVKVRGNNDKLQCVIDSIYSMLTL